MSTIKQIIHQLRSEADGKNAEANKIVRLVEKYPDLRFYVGRWGKGVFCSKLVNSLATKCDLRHNCGCCNDSPLEVWPYLETEDGPVYSDPPMFFVGERHHMGGDTPSAGWRDSLKSSGISDEVIQTVSTRFKDDREKRIEGASEFEAEYLEEDDDD